MRVKELQISPDVTRFLEANKGNKSMAAYIHSILAAYASGDLVDSAVKVNVQVSTNDNSLRRIISNDTTNHKAR